MTQSNNQPVGFCFINTAHPSEGTSFSTLSQIRSHAAKDIRARARRSQRATVTDEGSKKRVRRGKHVASAVTGEVDNKTEPSCTPEQEGAEKNTHFGSQSALPSGLQIPWLSSRDPQWSPARQLSDQELFLLDHYINYVVLFRKGSCSKAGGNRSYPVVGGNTKAWFTSMQLKCWLPFALSDLGLVTTLLLHACRSLDMLSGFPNYAGMYTAYKHQCIQFTNKSLSIEETRVSDATIAMVMALLSESYSLGNLEEWKIHLRGCTNMIGIRGGIDALGLDGFLKEIIVKSPLYYGHPSVYSD